MILISNDDGVYAPGLLVLQQLRHVHVLLQLTPAWKHSQYFFRHILLRQRQPVLWAIGPSAD